jgi:hypothetical protein
MELAAGATMSRPNKLSPALLEETEQRQRQMGLVFARIEKLARLLGVRWDGECRRVSDVSVGNASAGKRTGRRRSAAQRAIA